MDYFEILRETFFSFTWVEYLRIISIIVFAFGTGVTLKFLVNDIKDGFPLTSISILIMMLIQLVVGIHFGRPLLEHQEEAISITFITLFVLTFILALIFTKEPARK